MAPQAIGRREEIDLIDAVLIDVNAGVGGRIVELVGEAGIGKSTVIASVVANALDAGWRTWSASPTAAEAGLPWTGLAQILAAAQPHELDELAANHRDRLIDATSANRSGPVSPEQVAFALSALLDSATPADSAPLLLVVDDVHWLDPASAGALAFALRATPRRRLVVLLARRGDELPVIEPARLVDEDTIVRVELSGLGLATLREIIAAASGLSLGRAELVRISQWTGGNPLHTAQLARTLIAGVPIDPTALPPSLRESVGARVRSLPPQTRRVLGAAALTTRPTCKRLGDVVADLDILDALGPAEDGEIVTLHRGGTDDASPTVTFTHPLLAAAAIDALTSGERRDIHTALALSANDGAERATHLMAASTGPNETIAAELGSAADTAHEVGAFDAAEKFARACVEATPSTCAPTVSLERCERWVRYSRFAGRFPEAAVAIGIMRARLDDARERLDVDPQMLHDLRERLATHEVVVAASLAGIAAAEPVIERALAVTTDPARRYDLHARLVRVVVHQDVRRGVEVAERVFGTDTEHRGTRAERGSLLLLVARAVAGEPFDTDAAIALIDGGGTETDIGEFASMLVEPLLWSDHPRTIEVAQRALTHESGRGDLPKHLVVTHHLAEHLFVRGQWNQADDLFGHLGEYGGEFPDRPYVMTSHALLLAGRGDRRGADDLLDHFAVDVAADSLSPLMDLWARKQVGLIAHTLGRPNAAADLLDAEQRYAELGIRSVRLPRFRRDLVEALVAAGRLDDAAAAAERLADDAHHNQVATALADADAATAVVAAASGDHDRARDLFDAAADVQHRYDVRYELARTLLAGGSSARRAKRRAEADHHLARARQLFADMGAAVWVQRCDDEIARLGKRRVEAAADLTPTEQQIAEMVASGMTNAETASAMFVSVRTVESHLSRVYRKLGIRSRGALARALTESSPAR